MRKTEFRPGQKIDDYILEKPLGGGQDGEVWKVTKRSISKTFAIKFLNDDRCEKLGRFEREIQILAMLNHPHVITIFDRGDAWNPTSDGVVPYYVMEYLEGEPLDRALQGAPDSEAVTTACSLFGQVTLAVSAVHEKDVTHGDIKASNVMVMPREKIAKLTDFGFGLLPGDAVGRRDHYQGSSYRVPKGLTRKQADIHRLGRTFRDCLAYIDSRVREDQKGILEGVFEPLVENPTDTLLDSLMPILERIRVDHARARMAGVPGWLAAAFERMAGEAAPGSLTWDPAE